MVNSLALILVSFLASLGFAIVFRITGKDLIPAALGGALTRVVLIVFSAILPERFVYVLISALFASFYGEVLASITRDPSTFFIYPSIIPLIPGDLFYYTLQAAIRGDGALFARNGLDCLLTLLAMSVGFVVSSAVMHYIRRHLFRRKVRSASGAGK